MTATIAAFRPRYYSEIIRETNGYDDCALCSGLVLFEMATLREGVTKNDGGLFDTIRLRELRDEAGLRPDGPLRLNDIAQYLAFVSTKAGMDPAFRLDYYPGHPGGTLRLAWDEFRAKVSGAHVAILLGNPSAVRDPASPLRTKQGNDDYGHAIAVFDGGPNGATVYDALTRKGENWKGERVRWDDLRQFTEAKKGGDRLYGTPDAIACAVAAIGSETGEARAKRAALVAAAKANEKLQAQKAQTSLATEERDAARTEARLAQQTVEELRTALAASDEALKACRNAQAPDCTAAVAEATRVEHERMVALVEQGGHELVEELVGRIR